MLFGIALLMGSLQRGMSAPCVPTCARNGTEFQVCASDSHEARCDYLAKIFFADAGPRGLVSGLTKQTVCINSSEKQPEQYGQNIHHSESCYEHGKLHEWFQGYAESYAQEGGSHAGFYFPGPDPSKPQSYAVQPNRSFIELYYGGFVGRNNVDFTNSLPKEPEDAPLVQANGFCVVEPEPERGRPGGFLLFGIASKTLVYGTGIAILDINGEIQRQIATGYGAADQSKAAGAVAVADIPTTGGCTGKVRETLSDWSAALGDGDVAAMALLYTQDAKILVYNVPDVTSYQDPSLFSYTGEEEIENFLKHLLDLLGSIQNKWIETCEEAANLTAGNAFTAYTFSGSEGLSNLSFTSVFDMDGKIYGQGLVGSVKGLLALGYVDPSSLPAHDAKDDAFGVFVRKLPAAWS